MLYQGFFWLRPLVVFVFCSRFFFFFCHASHKMLQTQLNALRAKYAWCVLFAHYLRHAFCASAVRLATLLATRQIRQILNPLPNFNPRQILSHAFLRSTLNHPRHALFLPTCAILSATHFYAPRTTFLRTYTARGFFV